MKTHLRIETFFGSLAMLTAIWIVNGGPLLAGNKSGSQEGIVVKAGDGKLTLSDQSGKNERTLVVASTAKIACDGAPCKLEELKKGAEVHVTLDKLGDQMVASRIEAKTKKN